MPRTASITPALAALIARQDGVATARQLAENGFTADAVQHRVGRGVWRRLLPGVVLTHNGEPTQRQRIYGAWLWAGPGSAVDGASALRWYGVDVTRRNDATVFIVTPYGAGARNRSFVRVRRTIAEIPVGDRSL